jgi:hypothetical protein
MGPEGITTVYQIQRRDALQQRAIQLALDERAAIEHRTSELQPGQILAGERHASEEEVGVQLWRQRLL